MNLNNNNNLIYSKLNHKSIHKNKDNKNKNNNINNNNNCNNQIPYILIFY